LSTSNVIKLFAGGIPGVIQGSGIGWSFVGFGVGVAAAGTPTISRSFSFFKILFLGMVEIVSSFFYF